MFIFLTKLGQKNTKYKSLGSKNVNSTPKRIYSKSKHKEVLTVYGHNGDCFYPHVVDRSLTCPWCPGRKRIFHFHVEFPPWMAAAYN
jgi:hypothetical protein